MNSNLKHSLFALLLLAVLSGSIRAQNVNTYGFLPTVNVNAKLPKDWFTNLKIESRQEIYQDDFDYSYLRTDLLFVAGKKLGFSTKLAVGYQVIFENQGGVNHRFIQQIHNLKKYRTFILNHRFQADQTFSSNEDTEYRIRYRLSTEIPLNGQTLDANELYLKVSNEYLNAVQHSEYDLEIRVAVFVGYVFSPKTKLEIGFDNRVDAFIDDRLRNRFWLGLNIFQSL
ncbi:MAG: DUF2490 domain-containing protein [Bacteroidota bacterium]